MGNVDSPLITAAIAIILNIGTSLEVQTLHHMVRFECGTKIITAIRCEHCPGHDANEGSDLFYQGPNRPFGFLGHPGLPKARFEEIQTHSTVRGNEAFSPL